MQNKKLPRLGQHSEVWILPHEYSCGGYYIAERFPTGDRDGMKAFWLLSGQMGVLSEYQARHAMDYRKSLGETFDEHWADSLPEGSFWLNLRSAQ